MEEGIEIIQTADGSHTLINHEVGDPYHSVFGALTESKHIFIREGFDELTKETGREATILEIGWGTGLNAWLTLLESRKKRFVVNYIGIEPFPVPGKILEILNYPDLIDDPGGRKSFQAIHECCWNEWVEIDPFFRIMKLRRDFPCELPPVKADLVYFDAFSPERHPHMWSFEIFRSLLRHMNDRGLLVTYSSRGTVKENLRKAGFMVKRRPGPPGKRHIIRAYRTSKEE